MPGMTMPALAAVLGLRVEMAPDSLLGNCALDTDWIWIELPATAISSSSLSRLVPRFCWRLATAAAIGRLAEAE